MADLKKLISEMTLEQKLRQLVSLSYSQIYDIKNKKIREGAEEYVKEGIGVLGRMGGSNDNYPEEVAFAINEIQKFILEKSNVKIPALFQTEATTGVLGRGFTNFPGNLNVGATFDESLTRKVGEAIGSEMFSVGERIALAPVLDLVRDNRYGRFEEAFSEDKYVAAQHGVEYVKGMQTDDLSKGTATTLKHFVGQGISDGGRNCAPIHVGERELRDDYLAPFDAVIKETDPASLMVAYHEIDGVPCHSSKKLLRDILRKELGFKGMIMSDGNGVQLIKDFHEACDNYGVASKLALEAGIELELGMNFEETLVELVKNGEVDEKLVDEAVMSMLSLKEQLGLLENPLVDVEKVNEIVQSEKHKQISLDVAKSSIILLKNQESLLPLKKDKYKKIAVVGPLADNKEFAYGDYAYPTHIKEVFFNVEGLTEEEIIARSMFHNAKNTKFEDLFHETPTILEGFKKEFSDIEVVFEKGLDDTYNYDKSDNFTHFDKVRETCAGADLLVAVVGDTSGMGGCDTGESVDRVEITLSKEQRDLIRVLKEFNKPILLILANGRPYCLTEEEEICTAIVETFRSGQMGTEAIMDVLTGRYNPSGRMPMTTPRHQGQLPVYYSQRITGHKQFWRSTYLEMDTKPLYPFGYGLSYTTFEYKNFSTTLTTEGVKVKFTVENTGEVDGNEVVQVYVSKKYTSVAQPLKELVAFKKVWVESKKSVDLEVLIAFDSIGYHNIDMEYVLENCDLVVEVARSSEEVKLSATHKLNFENGSRNITNKVFRNVVKEI